ncbi:hypothetical protein J0S82_018313, partial [Galemys pyrenaicus]
AGSGARSPCEEAGGRTREEAHSPTPGRSCTGPAGGRPGVSAPASAPTRLTPRAGVWGGARARSAQAQRRPTAPSHLSWAASAGAWVSGLRARRHCPGAHTTSVLLGLGVSGGGGMWSRLAASPRLPVPGGDLKGRGQRFAARPRRRPSFLVPTGQTCGPCSAACAVCTRIAVPAGRRVRVDPVRAPVPGRARWPRPWQRRRLGDSFGDRGPAFSTGSTIPTPLASLHHHHHFSIFSSLVSLTLTASYLAASEILSTTSPSSAGPQLTMGKGEEGPGPELHSGCLDGLRSLFEGAPCPYPGALIPFQAPGTTRPSPATPSGDPSMEEHLAVMYERLRHELPNLFLHSHDYSLYSSDVEFINEILNIRTKGRTWYILSLTLCRFLAWNYFAQLRLDVLQLTRHPENWSLQARWRLVGLPIHMLFLRFYKRDKEELYRTYDAYSTFYLNSSGLICCHRLDKLMPSHSPPAPVKKLLVGALVTLGLSEPEPNLDLCSEA